MIKRKSNIAIIIFLIFIGLPGLGSRSQIPSPHHGLHLNHLQIKSSQILQSHHPDVFSSTSYHNREIDEEITFSYEGSSLWSGMHEIVIKDSLAYCAITPGLFIIDINDPYSPSIISQLYLEEGYATDLYIDGDHAYISGWGGALNIVDISEPDSPVRKGKYIANSSIYGVSVFGCHAYLACGNGLHIVDISNSEFPFRKSLFDTISSALKVQAFNDTVFLVDGDLWLIDVTNPQQPNEISKIETPYYAVDLYREYEFIYIADASPIWPPVISALTVVDISNPQSPELITSYQIPKSVSSIEVAGNFTYVGGDSKMLIFDILDPCNPVLAGTYQSPGEISGIALSGDYAYITDFALMTEYDAKYRKDDISKSLDMELEATAGDFQVVDVTNKAEPILVGRYATPGWVTNHTTSGDYAYVCDHDGAKITILNISRPDGMEYVGRLNGLGSPEGLTLDGNYLYIADGNNGLRVATVVDPSTPAIIGSYQTTSTAFDVYVRNNHCFIACSFSGLLIVDISKPEYPALVGSCDTPDRAVDVVVQDTYAYIADRRSGLQIIDISIPEDPAIVGSITTSFWVSNVLVKDDFAYITYGEYVGVVDISNPTVPELLTFIYIGYWLNNLAISGDYLFASNGWDGLMGINVSDPRNPYIAGSYNTPGFSQALHVNQDQIYLADIWSFIRLKFHTNSDVDISSTSKSSNVIVFRLHNNYPNPFNSETIIPFSLKSKSPMFNEPIQTTLKIYNIKGQLVRILMDGERLLGDYQVKWDGRDNQGKQVASGIYFYEIQAGELSESKKMLLIK